VDILPSPAAIAQCILKNQIVTSNYGDRTKMSVEEMTPSREETTVILASPDNRVESYI